MPSKRSSGVRRRWPWPSSAGILPVWRMPTLYGAVLAQFGRDAATTAAHAEALIAFATAQGLAHRVVHGRLLLGWALAMQGDAAAGVTHLQAGFEGLQQTGHKLYRPYFLGLLAEASGQAGQAEAGVTVVTEALTLVAATEERWWEAEVYRLRGELLLQLPLPDVGQADACFQQALDVARAPAGEGVGAARRAQPRSALAGARQTSGSARPARTGLRLVH